MISIIAKQKPRLTKIIPIVLSIPLLTSCFASNSQVPGQCKTIHASSREVSEDISEIRVPLEKKDLGIRTVFIDTTNNFLSAGLLEKRDGQWHVTEKNQVVYYQKPTKDGLVYDFSPNLKYSAETVLVIKAPLHNLNRVTITPLLNEQQPVMGTVTYYPYKKTLRGSLSPFQPLEVPFANGKALSPQLNQLLEERTNSGDLLMPKPAEKSVVLASATKADLSLCQASK